MHEAVRKMDSQEPTYLGTLFPAHMQTHSGEHSQQGPIPTSQTDPFTVPLLDKFNTNLVNLVFNVVTLMNAFVHCAQSHKSRAAVDYTPIGVEPHRPTRGV